MPSYNNNTFDDIVYRNSTYYGTAEYLKSKVNNNSWEPVKGEDFINSVNESVIWWNNMTTQPTSTDIVTISAAISPIVGLYGDVQDGKTYIRIYSDDDSFNIQGIQSYSFADDVNMYATLIYSRVSKRYCSINREGLGLLWHCPPKIYLSQTGNSHSYWNYSGVMSLTRQVGDNIKTYTTYKMSKINATLDNAISINELNLNTQIFNLDVHGRNITIFHTLNITTSAVFTATASVSDVFRL